MESTLILHIVQKRPLPVTYYHQITGILPQRRISLSLLTNGAPCARQLAAMKRSAGSPWNAPGSREARIAVRGGKDSKVILGRFRARSIHWSTSSRRPSLPFETSMPISQQEIICTPSCSASRIAFLALTDREGDSFTHHSQACVSRIIIESVPFVINRRNNVFLEHDGIF